MNKIKLAVLIGILLLLSIENAPIVLFVSGMVALAWGYNHRGN